MSTKTAQLGGTASNVTIGKIGVSAHPRSFSTPMLISPSLARVDDDDVRTSLHRILCLSINDPFQVA
jgi:hypothetical protein